MQRWSSHVSRCPPARPTPQSESAAQPKTEKNWLGKPAPFVGCNRGTNWDPSQAWLKISLKRPKAHQKRAKKGELCCTREERRHVYDLFQGKASFTCGGLNPSKGGSGDLPFFLCAAVVAETVFFLSSPRVWSDTDVKKIPPSPSFYATFRLLFLYSSMGSFKKSPP